MSSEPEGITPPGGDGEEGITPPGGDGDGGGGDGGGGESEADGAEVHSSALSIGHCSPLVPEIGVIVPLNEFGLKSGRPELSVSTDTPH